MKLRKYLSVVAGAAIAVGAAGPVSPVRAQQDAAASVLADRAELDKAMAGDTQTRIASLEKFLTDHPQSLLADQAREALVRSHATVGEVALKNGDPKGATEAFTRALAAAGDKISKRLFENVIWQMPVLMASTGFRSDSIDLMRSFEKRFDAEADRLIQIGFFYVSVESPLDAARVLERAVALAPNDHKAHNSLGTAYIIALRLDEAANEFAKAIELDPKEEYAYTSLANLRRATGSPAEAVELYKKQLEVKPDDPETYGGLAVAYLLNDDDANAAQALAQALALSPRDFRLYTQLAFYYVSRGNPDKAREMVDISLKLEPRFAWTHIALGNVLLAQKRYPEAIRALSEAQNYGDFPTLHFELAKAFMVADQYPEAIDRLSASFDITDDGQFETRLGDVLDLRSSKLELLLERERQAVLFMPIQPTTPTQYRLAEALARFGHFLELVPVEDAPVAEAEVSGTTATGATAEPGTTATAGTSEQTPPATNHESQTPAPANPDEQTPAPANPDEQSTAPTNPDEQDAAPANADEQGVAPTSPEGQTPAPAEEKPAETTKPAEEPAAAQTPPAEVVVNTDPHAAPSDAALLFRSRRAGTVASAPKAASTEPGAGAAPAEPTAGAPATDPGATPTEPSTDTASPAAEPSIAATPEPAPAPAPPDPNGRALAPALREQILASIDAFVGVDDGREPFRKVWVARQLADKGILLDRAEALAREALEGAESATELDRSVRDLPDLDRDARKAIFTARAEDALGWVMLKRGQKEEALGYLQRGVEGEVKDVKDPEHSTRLWHLAVAKQESGNDQEALDLYLKAYDPASPSAALRKRIIESLYVKVHGSADGLDEKLGRP